MHVFGWASATSQIALLDDAVKSPMPSLGTPPSEPPAAARKALDRKIAGVGERRRYALRASAAAAAATAAAAAEKEAGRAAWRDAFSGAGAPTLVREGRGGNDTSSAVGAVRSGAHTERLLFDTLPITSKAGTPLLAEAADLQPWFTGMLPQVNTMRWKVNLVDGHKMHTIGRRKPDNVHYARRAGDGDGAVQSEYNIAYVGDWKSQKATGSGDMTEDELAHMIDFLMELARVQPWRRRFVGYLLDGLYVVFLSATFDPRSAGEGPILVSIVGGAAWIVFLCPPATRLLGQPRHYCLPQPIRLCL